MKQNIKQAFETLALAVVCTVWVLSLHQSCSGVTKKVFGKKTEINKVQELKTDTINTFKLEQKVR